MADPPIRVQKGLLRPTRLPGTNPHGGAVHVAFALGFDRTRKPVRSFVANGRAGYLKIPGHARSYWCANWAVPEHTISVRQPAKKAWRNGIDDESIIVAIRIGDY